MNSAIILAAGKGTRMVSDKNKVMHEILGKPMIQHVVDNINSCHIDTQIIVVGHDAQRIKEHFQDNVLYAYQNEQLGTGHAVMQADMIKENKGYTLITFGDVPLVQPHTIQKIFDSVQDYDLVVATTFFDDPAAYGRIVKDANNHLQKIVEFKDATSSEKEIKEISTGIFCVNNELLFKHLSDIKNDNAQQEYYLTDLVEIFNQHNLKVGTVVIEDNTEVMGINNRVQLYEASAWLQKKINTSWMEQGVTLIDPNTTYIDADVVIGKDTIIYPNVHLQKGTIIKDNVQILPNSFIVNSLIGSYTTIDSSRITDSQVDDHCSIGPFAHFRNHSVVARGSRVGNFVEFKNSTLGEDGRCAHLTYLGDTTVGKKVNFGCGVVTVNYDGKNKYPTEIKDGAFIGSNVNLIAPVKVGYNAVVAAGTTITEDVEDGAMAIGRARPVIKPDYGIKYKNK